MTDKKDDEKKALYELITQQLDDATLLWRMRELGFWPENEPVPEESAANAEERAKLNAELTALRKLAQKALDPEKALAVERIRRWQESKKRRAIAKAEREAKRKARAQEYAAEKRATIVHAGDGVSAGLADRTSDVRKLGALPILHESADIAKAMGIELSELRWLTYHRRATAVVHYHRYDIPKKTGFTRAISAPKPMLAHAQRWILENILDKLSVEPDAHGFVRGRSIVTNAKPHVKRGVVINLDLRDFFPSITFRRVKGLFHKLGYSEHAATVLALICTEPPRAAAILDGKTWGVALGDRMLPQGACTSPAITNAICRRLDRRLRGLAARHAFVYTRYADDLTFSGDDRRKVGLLLSSVRSILTHEGFVEHAAKTHVMGRGRAQEVTGLVVNEKVALDRDDRRNLRALLYNAARHGLASQNREDRPEFERHVRGLVAFACMAEPDRAPKWQAMLDSALRAS
jgi:RNA-directed DNA polymerase